MVNAYLDQFMEHFRFLGLTYDDVSLVTQFAETAVVHRCPQCGSVPGVSAGAVSSKPQLFRPGGGGPANNSLFLAKPNGPAPEQLNREWFAKQAGQKGAQKEAEPEMFTGAVQVFPPSWVTEAKIGELM